MHRPHLLLIVPTLAVLAACSSDRTIADRLGMGRNVPDEFQVVERAPLTLPPEYALRPPEPGAPRPQEGTTSQQAQRALLGAPLAPVDTTAAQMALLDEAGAAGANPDIRTVIADESTGLVGLDEDRFWFILDFQRRAYGQADSTPLDARDEAARLAEAGVSVRATRLDPVAPPPAGGS